MKKLDWKEIIRLVDVERLGYAEVGRRMKKTTAAIRNAYITAKQQDWTADGPPDGTSEVPTAQPTQQPTVATPEGPRTRRHILIDDALWERAQKRAKEDGQSIGYMVNRALAGYLAGGGRDG